MCQTSVQPTVMFWRILLSVVAQACVIHVLAGFGGTETFPSQTSTRKKSLGMRSGDLRGQLIHPLN